MKNKLILLILLFLCFGCTSRYNIEINDDLSVDESIIGLEDQDFYDKYYNSSKERVINFAIYTVKDYLKENYYSKKIVSNKNYTGLKVATRFKNLEEYFEKSKAYYQLYNDWDTSIKGNIVKISLKDKIKLNRNSVDRYIINDCIVTIKLPFYVRKNNADSVDKKTNTYTWNLIANKDKDIYIEFDKKRKFNHSYTIDIVTYIIIGVVSTCVVIGLLVYMKKRKTSNKI